MATIEYDLDLTGGLMDVSIMRGHERFSGLDHWDSRGDSERVA